MIINIKRLDLLLLLVPFMLQTSILTGQSLQRYESESQHMGTTFQIILYAENDSLARLGSEKAFNRIDELNSIISDYIPNSELSRLSQKSGTGEEMKISPPLFDLLVQSVEISIETDGWFDITIGPYTHIWRGLNRMFAPALPDSAELANARSRVGFSMISLNPDTQTAELTKPGMRLDPGGIGKGFAADKALQILRDMGIPIALINAGGDISAGNPPPNKDGWSVAIPVQVSEDSTFFEKIIIANRSVNTSGSLYQSVEIDGKNYSHIINPKTGLGHTEQVQVSVIATDGADADAFATALNVMPTADAQKLVESRPDLEAVIFRMNDNGIMERWASSGFDNFIKP